MIPVQTLVARIGAHGDPAQVLTLAEVPLRAPGPGEVLLRMQRAPINPADINVIEGTYGWLPALPAVPGNEGVGEVVAIGPGVDLPIGARVRPSSGTWCAWMTVVASSCQVLPIDLPVDQAAMLTVNPATAWRILADFVDLQPGDWVVQNAATSAVGRCLIALCRERGVRTANLVRRAESVAMLQAVGADVVLVDDRSARAELQRITADRPPRLALNAVGGDSAATLAAVLAPQGTLVTIGAMARQPLRLPNGPLIFKELRAVGFWVSAWYRRASPEVVQAMIDALAERVRSGVLHQQVAAVYPLAQVAEAVAHARRDGRDGKVLLALDA